MLQQLITIYNSLLQVHTCGEDSFLITDCMRALRKVIQANMPQENKGEKKEE